MVVYCFAVVWLVVGVAVVAEPEDVFAGLEAARDFDFVQDTGACDNSVHRWKGVLTPRVARWVVAARGVATSGRGARKTGAGRAVASARAAALLLPFLATTVVVLRVIAVRVIGQVAGATVAVPSAGDGKPAPRCARRRGALVDKDWCRHWCTRAIREQQLLLLLVELQMMRLETALCERLLRRAQPVGVPTAVVEDDVPAHLCGPANRPLHTGRQRRKLGAFHAVVRCASVHVFALLRRRPAPRGATCEAACVRHRGKARCPPRVVPIYIVHRVAFDCGSIGVEAVNCNGVTRQLADEPPLTEVCLAPAAHMVTLGAADEAALAVPEGGLAIAAGAAEDVGALALEPKAFLVGKRDHEGIDRVARSRVHNRTVARGASRERNNQHGGPHHRGYQDLTLRCFCRGVRDGRSGVADELLCPPFVVEYALDGGVAKDEGDEEVEDETNKLCRVYAATEVGVTYKVKAQVMNEMI